MPTDLLNDFDRFPFSGAGKTKDVYRAGSGPAVIWFQAVWTVGK